MFRKMLISVIIVTAVFAAGSIVYAQSGTDYGRDTAPVFQLLSDKEETKTFSREYIISGKANEGTQVTIDLYWFKAEDEKSIITAKKEIEGSEKEGDWIFQQTEELTVGASGIFMEPIALNLGLNRILLLIENIDGNTDEIELQVERFWEKQATEEVSGNTINKCVDDISNIANSPE